MERLGERRRATRKTSRTRVENASEGAKGAQGNRPWPTREETTFLSDLYRGTWLTYASGASSVHWAETRGLRYTKQVNHLDSIVSINLVLHGHRYCTGLRPHAVFKPVFRLRYSPLHVGICSALLLATKAEYTSNCTVCALASVLAPGSQSVHYSSVVPPLPRTCSQPSHGGSGPQALRLRC